jgi:hypothetical protein
MLKITLLALTVLSAGCQKGNAAKLEGRWRGIKATGVPSDKLTSANLFASKMELEFHGEQVSVHNGDDKQSSKFHVVQDDKDGVVIVTDVDGPTDKQRFTFTDDRTIEWAVLPTTTIQFAKE